MKATDYTQFDWASDRLAWTEWASEEEERLLDEIDRSMRKRTKRVRNNRKNHRNYA